MSDEQNGFNPGPYSQNDQLPYQWSEEVDAEGNTFYSYKNGERKTSEFPKIAGGWVEYADKDGIPYFANATTGQTTYTFPLLGDAFPVEFNSGVSSNQEQAIQQQPVLDIPMPDNIILTETERALINSMQDGAALLVKIDEYDGEFEKLKGLLASPEAQPFNLSVYTEKLEAFRLLLIEKLKSLKDRIVSISNLAGLSTSLIKKLEQAKAAYQSIAAKLSAATNPAEYKALGVKIAELERLLDDSPPSVGGRRRSKTKHRKYRGKKTKTKRVKRTKTRKIKRKGGKCNCSLWSK